MFVKDKRVRGPDEEGIQLSDTLPTSYPVDLSFLKKIYSGLGG